MDSLLLLDLIVELLSSIKLSAQYNVTKNVNKYLVILTANWFWEQLRYIHVVISLFFSKAGNIFFLVILLQMFLTFKLWNFIQNQFILWSMLDT